MSLQLPFATSDPEPSILERPEGPLCYVDEGPPGAPALLALHGIPGSVRDFRYLAPALTERLRFVRVDLPGFGGSPPVPEAISSLHGRADAVLDLADHLGLGAFGVLGHSMGGATALTLAAAHADRVGLLVLVASVGLTPHRALGGIPPRTFARIAALVERPFVGRALLPIVRDRYRRLRLPGSEEMDAAAHARHLRAIGALDFVALRRAAQAALPPTLVAYAKDDALVEPRISEELARALSAHVLAFDSGGHNIQKTRAPQLGQAILRSVAGVTRPRG
jgi:pimeloyl-ACP methyl ester carboxylesterase